MKVNPKILNTMRVILVINTFFLPEEITHEVAYVEYLKATGKVDPETESQLFEWERPALRFGIVDTSNILKIVFMIPTFTLDDSVGDTFLLNEYLFRL